MRDPSRRRGSHALYQGLTLVGPQRAEKELGFTGCGKSRGGVGTAPSAASKAVTVSGGLRTA